jgi:hypothetical protein
MRLARSAPDATTGAPAYALTASVFLRLLGLTYAVAIVSLWVQVEGLIGSRGILPATAYLARLEGRFGARRFLEAPTLAWIGAGDGALHALCACGTALALVVAAGLAPTAALALLWAIYLSLAVVGQDFFFFQWDNLLLETGLLAVLLLPPTWRIGGRHGTPRPSPFVVFLLRFLLFRLMLGSGLVKVASGDPAWWPELTALTVHYETTPLPTWTSFLAHQAPAWFHRLSCAAMLASELVVPFLVLGPRRLRLIAFAVFVGQQLAIAATGNYAFFNLLTVVLCLPLLDDACWPARWQRERGGVGDGLRPARPWTWGVVLPLGAVALALGAMIVTTQLDRFLQRFGVRAGLAWPAPLAELHAALRPFRSVNSYGLFARMTKERPEIVVEGSDDGDTWHAYELRWKPGDPRARPRFVAPHQPRLDWQMWFAALGGLGRTPWFLPLLRRLLEGAPEVRALLAHDPFPERPPRYVRAVLYDYRFTDLATVRREGAWWRREPRGVYAPPVSLR